MAAEEEADVSLVLATAGDIAVGKTCLLIRFAEDKFSESAPPTIGVDSMRVSRDVLGKPVAFCVFDTSGDERYHSVTRSFYRGRDAVVLVYDMSDLDTLQQVRDFWLPSVMSVCNPETVIALVGAKSDKEREESDDRLDVLVGEIADALEGRLPRFFHCQTSAKSGDGVEETFAKLATEVIRVREESGVQVSYVDHKDNNTTPLSGPRGAQPRSTCCNN